MPIFNKENLTPKNYDHLPLSDRTREMEQAYQDFKQTPESKICPFCSKQMLVKEYKYWILLENRFPYSMKWKVCDMLAPRRHTKLSKLSLCEIGELITIAFSGDLKGYDCFQLNANGTSSISEHDHLQLLKGKL